MRDFLVEHNMTTSSRDSTVFTMACPLCSKRGDPATFFGRFCSMDCSKKDKMNGHSTQSTSSRSRNLASPAPGRRSESVSSRSATPQGEKSPQKNMAHTDDSTSNVSASEESSQTCIVCGKNTNGKLMCSQQCRAANARRSKRTTRDHSLKCSKCDSSECVCLSSRRPVQAESPGNSERSASVKRKRSVDMIDLDNIEVSKRTATTPTGFEHSRETTPISQNFGSRYAEVDSNNARPLNSQRPLSLLNPQVESLGSSIKVDNVRSIHHHRHGDVNPPIRNSRTPQWGDRSRSSSPDLPRMTRRYEDYDLTSAAIRLSPEHSSSSSVRHYPNHINLYELDNHGNFVRRSVNHKVPTDFNQTSHKAANRIVEPSTVRSRYPPQDDSSRLQNSKRCSIRNQAILEDDTNFARGIVLPEDSEIYKLYCDEIRSRIAVNKTKQLLLECELEKSKLEKKALKRKLNDN